MKPGWVKDNTAQNSHDLMNKGIMAFIAKGEYILWDKFHMYRTSNKSNSGILGLWRDCILDRPGENCAALSLQTFQPFLG